MDNFVKVTYLSNGSEFDVIVNINDIARLSYGFNQLEFRTPFPNGDRSVSVSKGEFARLEKLFLGGRR